MASPLLFKSCIIAVVLSCLVYPRPCCGLSIDEIISRSMKTPSGYRFMYDEASSNIRVDMDMIFSIQDWNRLISLNDSYHYYRPYKRQAIREGAGGNRWPNGIIPYEIDSYDFRDRRDEQTLYDGMDDWMRYTCVRFTRAQPYTTNNKIRFVDGDGCSSSVGMVGKTQKVTLAHGCRVKGVVIHELGHVLGFHHEQTRPDRDEYVKILRENIPDHLEYNFRRYNWGVIQDLGVSYDYLSIMHYGSKSLSSNGRNTIETLNRFYQDLIGNRDGLSFRDIKSANLLYDCRPADCRLRDSDCPGEGFVSKNCECWCPSSKPYGNNPYVVCYPGGSTGGNGDWNGGSNDGNSAGGCEDQHPNCAMWQSRGECDKNPFYMHDYCRRSCGLCSTVDPRCEDKYQPTSCRHWMNIGYCRASSDFSSFMAQNCRQTCGFCQNSGDLTTETPTILPRPCERNCEDENENCQMWALRGECHATPDYMRRHCRKTCNTCCSWPGYRYRSHPHVTGTKQTSREQVIDDAENTSQGEGKGSQEHGHRESEKGVTDCVEKMPYV